MTRALPRLHAVTDDRVISSGKVAERARTLAASGGAGLAIHLRSRDLEGRAFLALAQTLREVTTGAGSWLVINGRADVAALVAADAVVSGRGGLSVADLERAAPGLVYGRSVHDAHDAQTAIAEGADFLVTGSVFATASHPDAAPQGLPLIRDVAALGTPVIGIGGITPEHGKEVLGAGAHGVAAIRALWDAPDPAEAVRSFLSAYPPIHLSVLINGERRSVAPGSLQDLLSQLGLDPRGVVVEHNRRIVRREGLREARLEPGDNIELVHFVGGG